MKAKTRMFLGAFLTTAVLIGGVAGFMAVDLSTQRYMPGRFSHLFLVDSVGPRGAAVSWMGQSYYLNAQAVGRVQEAVWSYRSFLPHGMRLTGNLAVRAMEACQRMQAAREAAG